MNHGWHSLGGDGGCCQFGEGRRSRRSLGNYDSDRIDDLARQSYLISNVSRTPGHTIEAAVWGSALKYKVATPLPVSAT